MDPQSLEVHPDKCCHILIGNKTNMNRIRLQIEQNPLIYKNKAIKEKTSEKWLGDYFHQDGVGSSVSETIKQKKGRSKNAIFELNYIIEDTKMLVIGGGLGAIEILDRLLFQCFFIIVILSAILLRMIYKN